MNQPPSSADGILISQDLFFGSKVTGTASGLGYRIAMAGDVPQTLARLVEGETKLILVDLALSGLSLADLFGGLGDSPRPPIVAFGAHVHTTLLDAARAAGCDEVLTRGQLNATLAELLHRHLGNA